MTSVRKISSLLLGRIVVADNKNQAQELYDKSRFGELVDGKIQYSLVEALYLVEKAKLRRYKEVKSFRILRGRGVEGKIGKSEIVIGNRD